MAANNKVLLLSLLVFSLAARILFSQTFYGVNEDAGSVEVTLSVESGILGVDYLVRVFTEDQGGSGSQGVAVGMLITS